MFLGIDCGTQGTKAALFDEGGRAHGHGHATHHLIESPAGTREQHPEWWVEAMVTAVREALRQADVAPGAVKAIGVSGQQHGLVVLDERMQSIRPAKLWNDTETSPQNLELLQKLGGPAAWFERIGIIPLTGYTLSKLLWLKQVEPENFARIRHILLPHEYLNYWLTGRLAAESGDASGTAYFDVRRRTWAMEPLAAIDGGTGMLERALPELVAPDEIVGSLRPEAAAALGLTADCLVSAGGGDNMMGGDRHRERDAGRGDHQSGHLVDRVLLQRWPGRRPGRTDCAVLFVDRRLAAAGVHDECDQCDREDAAAARPRSLVRYGSAADVDPGCRWHDRHPVFERRANAGPCRMRRAVCWVYRPIM